MSDLRQSIELIWATVSYLRSIDTLAGSMAERLEALEAGEGAAQRDALETVLAMCQGIGAMTDASVTRLETAQGIIGRALCDGDGAQA